jgi:shikimate dehydrogenase
MKEIKKLRQCIDEIDDRILELLNQRLEVAGQIGRLKSDAGAAVVDSKRESQIYNRLASLNQGPIREDALHQIFRAVIAAGRGIQNPGKKAGISSLYAVIGNPIAHSLSPVMHSTALAHCGLDGTYLPFRVENIAAAVDGIRGLGIRGASITLPHKISVMQYLDEIDPMAAEIGAVNTVVNRDGVLHGYNSDCTGAVKAIAEQTTIKGRETAVIGAGGAARAIAFGLKQEGAAVTIINRSKDRGVDLAGDLGCRFIALDELKKLPFQILVNATPAGMTPDVNSMPLPAELLKSEMTVMDMVYNPLKTKLLRESENLGCTVIDGVSMFVHQGAVQFELWTSQKAPVEVMRTVVMDNLSRKD